MTIPPQTHNTYSICIIGNNAKSVAAATALVSLGVHVHLLALSKSTDMHIERYRFDTPLCDAWQSSLDNGLLTYEVLSHNSLEQIAYDGYWLFIEHLPKSNQYYVLNRLKHESVDIFLSGVMEVCYFTSLANEFDSETVFYIPFTFLNHASIYTASIAPNLLLCGEKSPDSAMNNPVINKLLSCSLQSHIDSIKVIEFARTCMINIIASKLSLINEMARLADVCAVDMMEVSEVLKLDKRIGTGFLRPSWGFGGSTLQKELDFLKLSFDSKNIPAKIVEEVQSINEDQKELIFRKLWRYFDCDIANKKIVIWGAGYKSGTGRTKNSAIHTLLPLFWAHNVHTFIFDKLAQPELSKQYKNDVRLQFIDDAYHDLEDADALIILNWSSSLRPDISNISASKTPVFDAKNLLTQTEISKLSVYYTGIGRGVHEHGY